MQSKIIQFDQDQTKMKGAQVRWRDQLYQMLQKGQEDYGMRYLLNCKVIYLLVCFF
jgi:hypothetical protein